MAAYAGMTHARMFAYTLASQIQGDLMRQIFNFSAGPAMLPEEVLLQAQAEMLDWHGTGISIMELGHRGPDFKQVADQAESDLRELMAIPDHYHVVFLAGGASTQFAMVPLNLLNGHKTADYVDTGIWSRKAFAEANRYGQMNLAAQLEKASDHLLKIPPQSRWKLNPEAAYVHYTPNETIGGVEFHWVPQTGKVPLVADMTSMILSRPIDVNQYGIIYAGAQKNLGQAGITVVIIREDLVKEPLPGVPTLYQYQKQVESKSFYNTPPTYSWYILGLVLAWLKRQGGVPAMTVQNQLKAEKLYAVIDQYSDFYVSSVHPECRSYMNVVFNLKDTDLTAVFLAEAAERGLAHLAGHKLAGGVRASIYNAMPLKGVEMLVELMGDFVQRFG
jgi:phosphoserine aminotransferase